MVYQMRPKPISKVHKKQLKVLGRYLRELRVNEGMTQIELGDQLQLHRKTIQNVENGRNVTLLTVFVLANGLGIDIKDLMSIIDEV